MKVCFMVKTYQAPAPPTSAPMNSVLAWPEVTQARQDVVGADPKSVDLLFIKECYAAIAPS